MDGWIEYLRDIWLNSLLPIVVFFWIWMITFLFFFKGIDVRTSDVSIFRIIYTSLALICIISFQFSRDFWQKMIVRFWTFVIIYAVFVFIVIFLFQIRSIRSFCFNIGLTQRWQRDIGLPVMTVGELLLFLLLESLVIIMVVVMQLLLYKTSPIPSLPFQTIDKIVEILDTFFDITKLTVFGIIMTCIAKVNAIHFCFLLAAVLSMVLRRTIRYIIIQLISVSAAILLVSQMIMQLHFFSDVKNVTCILPNENITLSHGAWLGFGKIKGKESVLANVAGYICIIALVTIYTTVVKEKSIIQGLRQEAGWNPYKMFNDPTYIDADKDFTSYVKYLLKYGFYRYGAEFTLICIAMLIQARLDVWALIYSIWLVIFVLCSHTFLGFIWPLFKYFLLFSIPLQYASALGFWPEKCFGYLLEKNKMYENAFDWLYLPLGRTKPDAFKLFWDALVFLFALCQANVFDFERKHANDNLTKMSPPETGHHSNPSAVINPTTTFGLIRYAIFCSLPIVSAVSFFFAATSGITLFSVGYGVGFMLILWFADNYFLRPTEQTITFWKYLLIFNVFIILIKTSLQIPGCIFMHYLVEHSCWIVQLLGITCLKLSTKTIVFFKVPLLSTADIPGNSCWYLRTSVGIEWDVFCFISLMFHKRFLRSIYFSEMSKEAVLDVKFSNRAAKILEELNRQEMLEMREKFKKNMEKIRKNMVRLKEAQKRIRGLKITEPTTHQEAVTSGDYYMFDDNEKEIKLPMETEEDDDASREKDECGMSPSTPNVGKLMEAVMKHDIEQALKIAESTSSSSNQSTRSSSSGSKKGVKCLECTCKTTELPKSTLNEQNKKATPEISKKLGKPPVKEKKKPPAPIVVKDEKLLPTVNFDRRKSVLAAAATTKTPPKPIKAVEEKKKQCYCGCENCTCRIKFFSKTCNTICLVIRFAIAFVNGCMISICQIFNEIAYDYKYIRKQLYKEKHIADKLIALSSPLLGSDSITVTSDKEKIDITYQVPIYIRLLMSFYDVVMSSFNTVCFLTVLLLQMQNPTIFTIPLTMMVLLWGSLSVPRPTKRFWKVLVSYAGLLLVFESILRIQFIKFDMKILNTRYLQVDIFDVDQSDNYSIYYLNVILSVFLQRRILMNIGMWSEESVPRRRGNMIRSFYEPLKNFFKKLIYENYNRIPVDVYTAIFLCDFVNIFIFIFGFASITERREDGVSRYFAENKIPPAMLLLFITQCLGIFVDRWIYLRRHVLAKLIFQIVQIILIHLCLFLLLPTITTRKFNEMFFPSIWYGLKSIYFLLSAYQIRRGYPESVHGNALCQSYSVVNIYLVFPFVYELRTVTDWMWTETALTLTEWIGMEDIFCTVFQLKCWRNYDNKYSYKRGQKITSTVKFVVGGGIVFLFFLILLFPLGFFTFGRVAGKKNIPYEMEITFRIASYDPIFSSYSVDIRSITEEQWIELNDLYIRSPRASTFLSEYYGDDVGIVFLSTSSQSTWNLNSNTRTELIDKLKSGKPPQMLTQWKLSRKTENSKQSEHVSGFHSTTLDKIACEDLLELLQNNDTINKFTATEVTPKFLKVSSSSVANPVEVLMLRYDPVTMGLTESSFANVTFEYQEEEHGWWQAYHHYSEGWSIPEAADNIIMSGNNSGKQLLIFTFNDKIFPPGIFSYFSAQGILGLYTTFLISIGFIIRKLCRGRANQVFLDYLPNVDSILQLLLDIYFVREHKDGKLEEDLYAKLIFLFRSPETLIRWTRMPEESD